MPANDAATPAEPQEPENGTLRPIGRFDKLLGVWTIHYQLYDAQTKTWTPLPYDYTPWAKPLFKRLAQALVLTWCAWLTAHLGGLM